MDAKFIECFLRRIQHLLVDLFRRLSNNLLDASRMNSSVLDQALESNTSNFTPDRIEGRQNHCFGCIVNDDVYPRRLLKGSYVSSLSTDNATFHLVGRELNN